jgi:polyisoprenoid-binding protein YceI
VRVLRLVFLFLFLLLFSVSAWAEDCRFSFDVDKAVVQGTGYKFTEKAAVKGNFPGFKINKNEPQKAVRDLLSGLVVTVDLMTLESGNSIRNKNMRETLFSGILGDSVATVSVKEVGKDKIKAELKINEKTQLINFDLKISDAKVSANGVFDAVHFALGEQIAALKKRCGALHTGPDGKSKTWTDFAIEVSAPIQKHCGKKDKVAAR